MKKLGKPQPLSISKEEREIIVVAHALIDKDVMMLLEPVSEIAFHTHATKKLMKAGKF